MIFTSSKSNKDEMSHPKYRPDIDGLRAIAVLFVVFYHGFPNKLPGGFVGVDIFFVISGFLISSILFASFKEHDFSFSEFYARRIQRIFPSLILVLVFCVIFGWFVLLFDEYKQIGLHVASGSSFISNFIFWHESGYFDGAAETKPLLHLWSLGIEEQFYIFWPVLLWAAWHKNIKFIYLTATTFFLSFFINLYLVQVDVIADFYSPASRAWELLAGGLLALYMERQLIRDTRTSDFKSNAYSLLGFMLIVLSIIVIDKKFMFPGLWALFPVVGTVLIILASPDCYFNKFLLSNKILVWFGLISYPLYLWHWPLLSFARILSDQKPSYLLSLALILVSILFAWITYRYIERPIRFGRQTKQFRSAVFLVIVMIIIGSFGYLINYSSGKPFGRSEPYTIINDGDIGHLEFHRYASDKFYVCTPKEIAAKSLIWDGFIRCLQSKDNSNIDLALIGNSHAEHLFIGLAEQLPSKNVVFYIQTGRHPFISNKNFEGIYQSVIESKTIKKVIISLDWQDSEFITDEIVNTANVLIKNGKEVYFANDVPIFPFDPKRCKGVRINLGELRCITKKRINDFEFALFNIAKDNPSIHLLNTLSYFCNDYECNMSRNNELLYRDNHHLNIKGSQYVGKRLVLDYPELQK